MIPMHPFQKDTVERVCNAARQGHKVIVLCSPTGSGKSRMGCEIIRRASDKGSRSLFIVHRRRLVEQFSANLRAFDIDHGILMRGEFPERGSFVQVASRDTLHAQVETAGYPPADLVIVDEGRHACATEFRALLEHYKGKHIVLLDATPVTPEGTGLGPWASALVVSAPVTQLVRDKFLVPVKCYAPDREMVRGKAVKGIAGDLVDSWKKFAEDQPTVLFCSRVAHSHEAVQAYNRAGISAAHVDADTPDEERNSVYKGLETGRVQVVSNVGIIKEGVDLPCLGCCQFYMNVSGRVAWLQGCGRIMRPFPGKEYAILIDHSGSIFQHGFPDEDTEWTLEGNVDEEFKRKHDDGETAKVMYCQFCNLLYKDALECPQCGRPPAKPPRSIFAPPPIDVTDALLVEAGREPEDGPFSRKAKIATWYACLNRALKQSGTFGQASVIYKQKYKEWPQDDFPFAAPKFQPKLKIKDVYPDFGKKAKVSQ